MRLMLWQIALIVYMVLVAVSLLTNIQVVWMHVLQGIAAAATGILLGLGK